MEKSLCWILFSILFFLSCGKKELSPTSRAEKWILLEESLLFQEKESLRRWKEIEVSLQKQSLGGDKAAQKELQAWKEVRRDFELDNRQIINAMNSLTHYQVLSQTKEQAVLKEQLSNEMEIEYSPQGLSIFFPKEASGFRLLAFFPSSTQKEHLFLGREYGSLFSEEEVLISFDSSSYAFHLYQSPLSERAWEKIFLLSLQYRNQFITRNRMELPLYQESLERKKDE